MTDYQIPAGEQWDFDKPSKKEMIRWLEGQQDSKIAGYIIEYMEERND